MTASILLPLTLRMRFADGGGLWPLLVRCRPLDYILAMTYSETAPQTAPRSPPGRPEPSGYRPCTEAGETSGSIPDRLRPVETGCRVVPASTYPA